MASISPDVPKLPLAPRAAAYGSAVAFAVTSVALPLLLNLIPGLGTPAFAALATAEGATFIAVIGSQIYLRKQHEELLAQRTFDLPVPNLRPIPPPVATATTEGKAEVPELTPATHIAQLQAASPHILRASGGVVSAFLAADRQSQRKRPSASDQRAIERAFTTFGTVSANILKSEQQLFRIIAFTRILKLNHLKAVEESASPEAFFKALKQTSGKCALNPLKEVHSTTSATLGSLQSVLQNSSSGTLVEKLVAAETQEALIDALEEEITDNPPLLEALKRALEDPAYALTDALIAADSQEALTNALKEKVNEGSASIKVLEQALKESSKELIEALKTANKEAIIDALPAEIDSDPLSKTPQAWIDALSSELRFISKLEEAASHCDTLAAPFRTLKAKHATLPKGETEESDDEPKDEDEFSLDQFAASLTGPKKFLKYGEALSDFLAPVCAAIDEETVREHAHSIAPGIKMSHTQLPDFLENILQALPELVSDKTVKPIRETPFVKAATTLVLSLPARLVIINPFLKAAIRALPIEQRHKKALIKAIVDDFLPKLVDPVQHILFKDALREPLNEQMLGKEEFQDVPDMSEATDWAASSRILVEALGGYAAQLRDLDFSEKA